MFIPADLIFFQEFVSKVQTGGRCGDGSWPFAENCLVSQAIFRCGFSFVDVRWKGDFAEFIEYLDSWSWWGGQDFEGLF